MKIFLPGNQIEIIPDDFNHVPFIIYDRDIPYEINYFRNDVIHLVQMYCCFMSNNELVSQDYVKLSDLLNPKVDRCYTISTFDKLNSGVYQMIYVYDYNEDSYVLEKYEH